MKQILGFESYYVTDDGKVFSKKSNKFLSLCKDKVGYVGVCLSHNGFFKRMTIHRIVALAYLKNTNNYKEVNHKDGNKSNNNVNNLEWCSRSQNIKHAFETGLKKSNLRGFPKCKLVLDTHTGVIYSNPKEAAKDKCINLQTLYGYLSGHFKNKSSLIYY
jgi:hypothetical protein